MFIGVSPVHLLPSVSYINVLSNLPEAPLWDALKPLLWPIPFVIYVWLLMLMIMLLGEIV